MLFLLAVLFTLWLAASAIAGEFTGHVIGVPDGDTIEVLYHNTPNASASVASIALRRAKPVARRPCRLPRSHFPHHAHTYPLVLPVVSFSPLSDLF